MGIILTNKSSFGNKMSITQGAFSILNIPNLQAWWEGSYKVLERINPDDPAENGDPVRRWTSRPDSAPNNLDGLTGIANQGTYVTQESGFAKPFLSLVAANNQYLVASGLTSPSATEGRSIFIVTRANAVPASNLGAGMWYMGATNARYPDTDGKINEGIFRQGLINDITPTKNILNWQIYHVHSKTNDYRIYLGDELQHSTTTSTFSASTTLYFGYNVNSFWDGKVAEIILFSRFLTDAQRLTVTSYLSQKYNLSL
jgi:hypothetical protein